MNRLLVALPLFFVASCEKRAAPTAPPVAAAEAATNPSAPPAATPSAGSGPASAQPADPHAVSVPASNGHPGFRFGGVSGHGWSRGTPEGSLLIRLGGPPGGPLGFEVRTYRDGVSDPATLAKLFADTGAHGPIIEGKPETVTVAGGARAAQAFRTGQSLATTNTCVIKIPSAPGARDGLLILAEVGTNEKTAPECSHSLEHGPIKPIIESFQLQ